MAVLIDQPNWPGHGRFWSHLVSDSSFEELHAFAASAGLDPRLFEGDHYDVPAERYEQMVDAGAEPVSGRELLTRLTRSGLRRRKRLGERVVSSTTADDGLRVDVLTSRLPATIEPQAWHLLVVRRPGDLMVRHGASAIDLPRAEAPFGDPGVRQVGLIRWVDTTGGGTRCCEVVQLSEVAQQSGGAGLPGGLVERDGWRWESMPKVAQLIETPIGALIGHLYRYLDRYLGHHEPR